MRGFKRKFGGFLGGGGQVWEQYDCRGSGACRGRSHDLGVFGRERGAPHSRTNLRGIVKHELDTHSALRQDILQYILPGYAVSTPIFGSSERSLNMTLERSVV